MIKTKDRLPDGMTTVIIMLDGTERKARLRTDTLMPHWSLSDACHPMANCFVGFDRVTEWRELAQAGG